MSLPDGLRIRPADDGVVLVTGYRLPGVGLSRWDSVPWAGRGAVTVYATGIRTRSRTASRAMSVRWCDPASRTPDTSR